MEAWRGRAVALLVVLAVAVVAALVLGMPSRTQVQVWLDGLGPAAPVAFVVVYSAATLTPLPKNVLSVAAGFAFGVAWGVGLVWLASMAGACAAFALSRALGREAVEAMVGQHVAPVDDALQRHGTLAVVAVRLVPVLPFTPVNYALGLTALPWRPYVVGTALGIVPGTVAHVALGASVTQTSWGMAAAALTVVGLLSVAGALSARHWRATHPVR